MLWYKHIMAKLYQGLFWHKQIIAKLYWGYVLVTNFVCQKIPPVYLSMVEYVCLLHRLLNLIYLICLACQAKVNFRKGTKTSLRLQVNIPVGHRTLATPSVMYVFGVCDISAQMKLTTIVCNILSNMYLISLPGYIS